MVINTRPHSVAIKHSFTFFNNKPSYYVHAFSAISAIIIFIRERARVYVVYRMCVCFGGGGRLYITTFFSLISTHRIIISCKYVITAQYLIYSY